MMAILLVLFSISLPLAASAQSFYIPAHAFSDTGINTPCVKKWSTSNRLPYLDCSHPVNNNTAIFRMRLPNTASSFKLSNPEVFFALSNTFAGKMICYQYSAHVIRSGQAITGSVPTGAVMSLNGAYFSSPQFNLELRRGALYFFNDFNLRDESGNVCDSSCADGIFEFRVQRIPCEYRCTANGNPFSCCSGPLSGNCDAGSTASLMLLGAKFNLK